MSARKEGACDESPSDWEVDQVMASGPRHRSSMPHREAEPTFNHRARRHSNLSTAARFVAVLAGAHVTIKVEPTGGWVGGAFGWAAHAARLQNGPKSARMAIS